MNSHQYIQVMRLHLFDMARICQRGVDYSIKAYQLGKSEWCLNVQSDAYEINTLHREIIEIGRDLMLMEISEESAIRFLLSADRICNALHAVHGSAVEIAANSVRMVENCRRVGCKVLISMGDFVNSLLRLCVVAMFEEGIEHAETALQSGGVEHQFAMMFFDWYRALDQGERTQAGYEVALTKHLSQIARQMHEVAEAILFWLKDPEPELAPDYTASLSVRVEDRRIDSLEASSLPNGMDSLLLTIDECFTDRSFWGGK
jgi:phosphate uptake regulator